MELEPKRRNVFYIDANNAVVPGVIFRDYPNQGNETARRAQILPPDAYVKEHSHAIGKNRDGEVYALIGATNTEGKSVCVDPLPVAAAADSPTKTSQHSIAPNSRGWQYWLAGKKPNTEMPEDGTSKNWAGLDKRKGREAYWKANGMTMAIANDGMVTLTDIPSGEKTTIEHKGNEVTLRAYDGNGRPLDYVIYNSETKIASHYTIDGQEEEWDIKGILEKYPYEVPDKKKAKPGHSDPNDPEL